MAKPKSAWTARLPLTLGFLAMILLGTVVVVWGIQARIAGAIVASGMIEVETNQQVVQHPDGGVVGEILARDGDTVVAGQTVLKLDDTFLKSELTIIESQLFEIWAREARLTAERDEASDMEITSNLIDVGAEDLFNGQRRLFLARKESRATERDQIDEQARQLDDQITGISAELDALQIQLELIQKERADGEDLLEKGLIQTSRVLALLREEASLKGAVGRQNAAIAQLRGQIAGLELQKLRLGSAAREEAITGLRDLQFRESELVERRLALKERLARLDVRAPVSGTVFGSTIFALQSVIQPAATVMSIIPSDQPLIVAGRIEPIHVDQVHLGQEAALRFTALDQRRTPEVFGRVTHLSATAVQDTATGASYYEVQLVPNAEDLAKLGEDQVLMPGMPVDAFIKSGERSPLDYLAKPLTDYFAKAFRED